MKRIWAAVLVPAAAVALVLATAPAAAGAQGYGTARVTITAPAGVPANVLLDGKTDHVAAKPPTGTSATVTLSMHSGAYHVHLPRVNFDGAVYLGHASRPEVVVRPGRTFDLRVTYAAEPGARDLHTTALTQHSVSLTWSAPEGARFSLRRTVGTEPAARRSDGVAVPVHGTTAVDRGLEPGKQYSYALFSQRRSRWHGPLVVVAGTAPVAGSTDAAFIAAPSTLLAQPSDVVSAAATGSGVEVRLADQVPTPLLGSAIVLPVSQALRGGFLGVVTSVSADGRTVGLRAGGLSDAFDYYELAVDHFSVSAGGDAVHSSMTEQNPAPKAQLAPGPGNAVSSKAPCSGGAHQSITFHPHMSLGGHFHTKVDKYSFWGVDVPVGASLDVALKVAVSGAATVRTSGDYECQIPLPKLVKTLTAYPVPIAVSLAPIAGFGVSGGVEVSDLGVAATGGVKVAGTMSLKNGSSFSGDTIMKVKPLEPHVTANGSVALKLGGSLLLGPGAGTARAGVIAGIGGTLYPLDASFQPYFPAHDTRFNACTVAEAAFTRSLSLAAKAWLGKWHFSQHVTVDALTGSTPYGGSPWYLPDGCQDLPGSEPQDSLLGSGVTKVDDSTMGSSDQWGHVGGFVPGKKTWVLSTGLISDAVGTPGQFASTALGGPGDAGLTKLSGNPTFDAAAYQVTLVPAGSTLHVKYVFASEEYPEYVGSVFNDVMAVRVNGQNCATVPGTSDPVSVNTINAGVNSAYFVDNSAGAAGYSTTMDGLTKPLTCSVPVTPGKAVTVRIVVADSSDHVYDSAVALVDGGIWTD